MNSRAADTTLRCLGVIFPALLLAVLATGCGKSSKNPIAPPSPTTGSVYLRSIPASAKVLLNGSWVGNLTPELYQDLSAGSYDLTFRMLGYKDTTVVFTIRRGMTDTLTVALPPKPGTPRSFSTWKSFNLRSESVAVGPGGNVYALADYKFWVFSASGLTLAQTPLPWQQSAWSLAVNSLGQAYFGHDSYLYKYSSSGSQLARIGDPQGGFQRFDAEPHPAVGRNDTIFVAVPARDHPLDRFFSDAFAGNFWATVDSTLEVIAINPTDGTIYALASNRNGSRPEVPPTVLKLRPDGVAVGQWTAAVRGAITVAPDGSVYVAGVDNASVVPDGGAAGRIQHYSSSGVLLSEWGVENLSYTASSFEIFGLAVDSGGNIYATDFNGRRILKFAP